MREAKHIVSGSAAALGCARALLHSRYSRATSAPTRSATSRTDFRVSSDELRATADVCIRLSRTAVEWMAGDLLSWTPDMTTEK